MHQKLIPGPFFILVNNPKQPLLQGILLRIRYFERGLSKTFEKLTSFFFFRIQSLLIVKVIKNKKGSELGYETSHKNLFLSYQISFQLLVIRLLPDQVWWCNVNQFLSYSKNYTCKFMHVNSRHHKLFHFHLLFWIYKVWKGRGKITKIWISWERKELFRWIKNIFQSFWRAIIWWKTKKLIKNSGRML